MRRFFVHPVEPGIEQVYLDHEESHHLVKVLRLQVGDQVELFDGSGSLYLGEIKHLGKQVGITLLSKQQPFLENTPSIIVCQGDLKGGKIDFLVEKCTELGVERFIPFVAGRSQGRKDSEKLSRRLQRRQAIVKTACKQCGRLKLMEVDQDIDFTSLITAEFGPAVQKVILWEKAEAVGLRDVIGQRSGNPVCLMLGPEGGFSEEEVRQAQAADWLPVSLGNLILRAETATISAVAITRHLQGLM